MIEVKVETENMLERVKEEVKKSAYRNLRHAAASIRKDVRASIEKSDVPSAPGDPPHTHRRQFLRRAILYAADADEAVIGPRKSVVGLAGALHEFGGERKGQVFPERPYMLPALLRNESRFASDWVATLGEE